MAPLWKIFGLRRLDEKKMNPGVVTQQRSMLEKNTGVPHFFFLFMDFRLAKYDKLLRLAQMICILCCHA